MNSTIESMIFSYNPKTEEDRINAIKEVIQEIALAGLSKAGFFKKAAFYGGTCLRIFHGLDRFSEDLDFALLSKDEPFSLTEYFPELRKAFATKGMDIDVDFKEKSSESAVQSAFIKGNTQVLLMSFYPGGAESKTPSNSLVKVKFGIDTENPPGGITETKYRFSPFPYSVTVFDESTLFSGKIHAILARNYANRVKGRDYYDYLFYVGRGTKINMKYLENKLKATTGIIAAGEPLTLQKVVDLLRERFESVDYSLAKDDVSKFLRDKDSLDGWCKEMFLATLPMLH